MDESALARTTSDRLLALEGEDQRTQRTHVKQILREYIIKKYEEGKNPASDEIDAALKEERFLYNTYSMLGLKAAAEQIFVRSGTAPASPAAPAEDGGGAAGEDAANVPQPDDGALKSAAEEADPEEEQARNAEMPRGADAALEKTGPPESAPASPAFADAHAACSAAPTSKAPVQPEAVRRSRRPLIRRAENAPKAKPIVGLHLPTSAVVKALLLRIGLPAAFALVVSLPVLAGNSSTPPGYQSFAAGMAMVAAAFALWWTCHWFFAMWRKANADNDRIAPIVWACRYVLTMIALLAVAIFVCAMNGAGAVGGPWALAGSSFASLIQSGLPVTVAALALVRVASLAWRSWSATMEPTEALWWLDAAARIVGVLLHLVAIVATVASALAFPATEYLLAHFDFETGPTPLSISDPWWQAAGQMVSQVFASGVAGVIALFVLVYTLWKRGALWFAVREERQKKVIEERWTQQNNAYLEQLDAWNKADWWQRTEEEPVAPVMPDYVPDIKSVVGRRLLGVVTSIANIVLATALVNAVFSLISSAPSGMFINFWTYVLAATPFVPLAALIWAACSMLLGLVKRWSTATNRAHPFIEALAKLGIYAGYALAIALTVMALAIAEHNLGMTYVLSMYASMALGTPTIWSSLAQTIGHIVYMILVAAFVLIVILFLILAMAGSGGGGGSAAGYGGGGGGGYASAGGSFGSSSDSKRQNVNDRYGRKLVEVDDSSIFSPTTIRDRHGAKIGTAREGLDGSTRVQIGDDEYRVRDAAFSSDKIVEKDGEEVGRIRDSGWGDDRFYKK